jgi:glycosyl transferase, family 25
LKSMKVQLDSFGLGYERIEAVDGRKLTLADKGQLYSDGWYRLIHGHSASAGEIGVGLSHRKIYRKMVDENISAAIILEDDVRLLPEFAELLPVIDEETQDFDMVQLFSFRKPNLAVRSSLDGKFLVQRFSNLHASSAAYFLRNSGAVKLLKINKLRTLSDRWCWMSAMSGLRCCAIWPFPIVLHETLSLDSSVYRVGNDSFATRPLKPGKPFAWKYFVLPWLNVVKLAILRVRGI